MASRCVPYEPARNGAWPQWINAGRKRPPKSQLGSCRMLAKPTITHARYTGSWLLSLTDHSRELAVPIYWLSAGPTAAYLSVKTGDEKNLTEFGRERSKGAAQGPGFKASPSRARRFPGCCGRESGLGRPPG